jgi:hypothetical protein
MARPGSYGTPRDFVLQPGENRVTNDAHYPVRLRAGAAGSARLHRTNMAPATAAGVGEEQVDLVTIAVLGVIVISYVVGSLTSSVETEEKLPHRY